MATLLDAIVTARYIVDANGKKTEVVLPITTWRKLLATWEQLSELVEDREDRAILKNWLSRRNAGTAQTVSLDELEQELIADGLLPN